MTQLTIHSIRHAYPTADDRGALRIEQWIEIGVRRLYELLRGSRCTHYAVNNAKCIIVVIARVLLIMPAAQAKHSVARCDEFAAYEYTQI